MNKLFTRSALVAVLAAGLGFGLAGCKDAINIQPQQSIDISTAFNTPQKVQAAVVGCYARLDDPRLYGTDLILVPELLGSNAYINWEGTFQNYRQLRLRTQDAQNSNALGIWRLAYTTINQANLVLANLGIITDVAAKAQYEGEVRFIRGALYFELVRLYATQYKPGGNNTQDGVPINLAANTTLNQADTQSKLPRASVEQVYAQVISDLTAAMQKLPTQNVTRASKYSAEALLARVYLQQGNYTAARAAANNVITKSGAALVGSVAAVFANRNSAESLFEIQQNDQNNAGTSNDGLATYFAGYSPNGDQSVLYGRGDVSISGVFADLYDPADLRGPDTLSAISTRKLIYLSDGNSRVGRLRTLKWRTYGQNIPVIRLAEMYLIRAECDVRAGASADNDVNLIRQRSGAPVLANATLADVLLERQLELAFEGFRIYDLKRVNEILVPFRAAVPATPIAPAIPAVQQVLANASQLTLPIPQQERNNNPNLTQNPGY